MLEKKIISLFKENGISPSPEALHLIQQLIECSEGENQFEEFKNPLSWLEKKRLQCKINTEVIPIKQLQDWYTCEESGNIYHESQKFFSVIGVKISNATTREVTGWSQPILHQQETGILGIIRQRHNGIMHYLLQAKFEPGNVDLLQLSPTLQATRSNLEQAHGGKLPLFSEYFTHPELAEKKFSVDTAEDGGRFYLKSNVSMLVEVPSETDLNIPDNFIWLTLHQLKELTRIDNVFNSLVREVISAL